MATKHLLRLSLSSAPKISLAHTRPFAIPTLSSRRPKLLRKKTLLIPFSKAVEIKTPSQLQERNENHRSLLLDVSGMMCGACVSRVKTILSSDARVDSAVVNILTETAAIRLRSVGDEALDMVADDLARRLTECGFPSKRREAGMGIGENVRKWKEMAEKKEALLRRSRSRVAFAWTLVALCCGTHASHLLHSVGIHVGHGLFMEMLHNSYVRCGVALVSLFGPGRELLFDGVRAFMKGSPNMNSLVGFGSLAAFLISTVSLLNPGLEWDASFFDEPVMLLGFVLLGRSLEERARLKASSDMNELLALVSSQSQLVITSSEGDPSCDNVLSANAICVEVPTDEVRVGDSVLVLPGETVPVDGKSWKLDLEAWLEMIDRASNFLIQGLLGIQNSLVAELITLVDSLKLAVQHSLLPITLEGDSTVTKWSSSGRGPWHFVNMIKERKHWH